MISRLVKKYDEIVISSLRNTIPGTMIKYLVSVEEIHNSLVLNNRAHLRKTITVFMLDR